MLSTPEGVNLAANSDYLLIPSGSIATILKVSSGPVRQEGRKYTVYDVGNGYHFEEGKRRYNIWRFFGL